MGDSEARFFEVLGAVAVVESAGLGEVEFLTLEGEEELAGAADVVGEGLSENWRGEWFVDGAEWFGFAVVAAGEVGGVAVGIAVCDEVLENGRGEKGEIAGHHKPSGVGRCVEGGVEARERARVLAMIAEGGQVTVVSLIVAGDREKDGVGGGF